VLDAIDRDVVVAKVDAELAIGGEGHPNRNLFLGVERLDQSRLTVPMS
jgi:hypothetical protein